MSRPRDLRIEWKSQDSIEAYVGAEPYSLVSIVSPGGRVKLRADRHRVGLLSLVFHDFHTGHLASLKTKTLRMVAAGLYTRGMAEQVVVFVEGQCDAVELVVVHCEAGVSRSQSIAAALSDLYGDRRRLEGKVVPMNPHVYGLTMWAGRARRCGWPLPKGATS